MILHLIAEERLGPLDPKQQELLSAARDESDRLHHILENLLDMGRIESGRELMDMRPAPAGDLAGGTVEGMRSAFAQRNIRLEYDVPAESPQVLADPTRIAHVFANLLNNALRYTPSGGTVRLTSRLEGDFVEFSVSDTGSGIPAQYLHRVFEKFFRVPGQNGEGSGLGLAIVKDIIEAHGGRIVAESAEGRGSTFRFTLRRAAASREVIDHGSAIASHD
jgi:two-component system, NtrC family, sensor histidine kinase KinB